jgi:hypothetical protein
MQASSHSALLQCTPILTLTIASNESQPSSPDKYDCKAVKEAIKIVMNNNRMRFGSLIYHQIHGVAMGMSAAPTIANLYVVIYKCDYIIPFVCVGKYLMFYKRFIDDGFAGWLQDEDPRTNTNSWNDFKARLNTMGLSWTFKSPRKKLNFINMTIQMEGDKLITTIYAKALALSQYIPPNSCHPPRVFTGLIFGQILRIYQLHSCSKAIDKELSIFHTHLLNHGYTSNKLLPLFKKGINNAISYYP